jgi:hypothetical protein
MGTEENDWNVFEFLKCQRCEPLNRPSSMMSGSGMFRGGDADKTAPQSSRINRSMNRPIKIMGEEET